MRVEVVEPETPGAQFARLLFQVRGRHNGLIWLELRPHTGRKHQLRVQLASRGCPIYGDAKYGSDHAFGHAIGLHARSLTFLHPTTKEPITAKSDVPKLWRGRFAHLLNAGRDDMTTDEKLAAILAAVQTDPGNRGLARDPHDNLFTATEGDFEAACRSIAEHPDPTVAILTGFFIPSAVPPAFETDGPLGAVLPDASTRRVRDPVRR